MRRLVVAAVWLLAALTLGAAVFSQNPTHITIFVVGDFQGHLEPCGCSSPMLGGVERMARIIHSVPKGDRVLLVNGGLLSSESAANPALAAEEPMKAEAFGEIFKSLNALAVNIGQEEQDRGFGVVEAINRLSGGRAISASISDLPKWKEHGSFMVESLDHGKGAKHTRPSPFTQAILYRGGLDGARWIHQLHPFVRLIVYKTLGSAPDPIRIGNTWLVSPGSEGREMLQIEMEDNIIVSCYRIKLTPDIKPDDTTRKLYAGFLSRVNSAGLLDQWPRTKGDAFAGPDACLKCHKEASDVWLHSAHARAFPTLQNVGHGRDPDCVVCHVTGLSDESGFRSLALTPKLGAVTCESCHGPAAKHAADPKAFPLAKIGKDSCLPCHTSENSPKFEFESYWTRIKH